VPNIGFIFAKGGRGQKGGKGADYSVSYPGGNGAPITPPDPPIQRIDFFFGNFPTNDGLPGNNGASWSAVSPQGGAGATTFLNTSTGFARIYKL